ncbi:MAG: triose-phosphate isomerase [Thermomicrobiales bacterium]
MGRTPLIAGNWKMNLNREQARMLATAVASNPQPGIDIALFPPAIWLTDVAAAVAGSPVKLGAQNCWSAQKGAFTGELSPAMIAEIAPLVLIGHSERRLILGESDELIRSKIDAALVAGLDVVLCVGETLETRQAGHAESHVANQLHAALNGRPIAELDRITIAYEPVWAIGTGVAATPADAQHMSAAIRTELSTIDAAYADSVRILYGGSVNTANAAELLSQPDVDGGLVGGASLVAQDFLGIIAAASAGI